ncbi:MAG TPA: hypothetical protein VF590_22955 [Isosphaeraceae bacterium]|jgi:hypothetical protein
MASKRQTTSKGQAPRKRPASAPGSATAKGRAKTGQAGGANPTNGNLRTDRNVLERGDIFFFYRPDVGETAPGGLLDVRRFHLVLRPEGKETLRLITIGRKTLPGQADGDRNHWGFVDRVFGAPEELRDALAGTTYETETRGERQLPEARPAGEGVYALARSGRNSVLAYVLELPEEPGVVQEAFHIGREGRFVLAIKNPEAARPPGIGLDDDRKADFPDELRERFGARKWLAADPPEFLDYEGAELVLIGGRDADADLGIELEPQPEDEQSAEVFEDLHLERSERTVKPLFEGTWE